MTDKPKRTRRTPEQREADLRAQLAVIAEMKQRDLRKRLDAIASEIDSVCAANDLPMKDKLTVARDAIVAWLAEASK